ncbi:hypothetical protein AcW1_007432 [Taiwanofungus camphoratus]|nr:hypothetical protein AcW1_007432 [Antrodia cinnamomea]
MSQIMISVFEAAAISIQVKLHRDDDDNTDSAETSTPTVELQRTETGIISNRRPKTGTAALSGSATPSSEASGSAIPRMSVMAAAKQEAAKRMLYSTFYRGPVIGCNDDKVAIDCNMEVERTVHLSEGVRTVKNVETAEEKPKKKKDRKAEHSDGPSQRKDRRSESIEVVEGKRGRKRQKQEVKEGKKNEEDAMMDDSEAGVEKPSRSEDKAERKRRRKEKRARKEERLRPKLSSAEGHDPIQGEDGHTAAEQMVLDQSIDAESTSRKRKRVAKDSRSPSGETVPEGKAKKKRKKSS